jgi:hypothetical protein
MHSKISAAIQHSVLHFFYEYTLSANLVQRNILFLVTCGADNHIFNGDIGPSRAKCVTNGLGLRACLIAPAGGDANCVHWT